MGSQRRVLVEGLSVPEAPRWHDGRLWLSDIYNDRVVTVELDGHLEVMARVQMPSGIGFLPDATPIVVSMAENRIYAIGAGRLDVYADLSAEVDGGMLNDMIVASSGRAYVGCWRRSRWRVPPEVKDPREVDPAVLVPSDVLFLIEPGGKHSVAAEEVISPNGPALADDGCTLTVAETYGHRLTTFDVMADGRLTGRRLFASLSRLPPDGICLDAEGSVWVGAGVAGAFLKVGNDGAIKGRIEIGRRAVACVLGGADRRTLFLMITDRTTTTSLASPQGPAIQRDARPPVGWVETLHVAVPGVGVP